MNFDQLCRVIALTADEELRAKYAKGNWEDFKPYLLTWSFEPSNAEMRSLDCTLVQLVRARDEKGARQLATAHAGEEGKEFWLDPSRSVCIPIDPSGPPDYLHVARRPPRPAVTPAEARDFSRVLRRLFIRWGADYANIVKYTVSRQERDVLDYGLTQGWLKVWVPDWSYDARYALTDKGREELSALPDEEPLEPVMITWYAKPKPVSKDA